MGRHEPGTWSAEWTAPDYTVDENGKVVGFVNDRQPNNWGRWGDLDEVGTVNLITPEIVKGAAGLIEEGRIISCAIPLDSTGPVHPSRSGPNHWYAYSGADFIAGTVLNAVYPNAQVTDDYLSLPLQGSTQWDGLAHFGYRDTLYNGFWLGNVEGVGGAHKLSIHQLASRMVGRGVLVDVARHKGKDRLEQGYGITVADLEDTIAAQGVDVRSGDILIVRTGHVPWWYTLAPEEKGSFFTGSPGITGEVVQWLADKDVAALAVDNLAVEVEPHEEPFEHVYPLHARLIRDLGLTLGEIWHLEELAQTCADAGRHEFFVAAAPLNVTNASGSPLNPIVVW